MNTFEVCKQHANGHFPTCLLCEVDACRAEWRKEKARADAAEEKVKALELRLARVLHDAELMAKRMTGQQLNEFLWDAHSENMSKVALEGMKTGRFSVSPIEEKP